MERLEREDIQTALNLTLKVSNSNCGKPFGAISRKLHILLICYDGPLFRQEVYTELVLHSPVSVNHASFDRDVKFLIDINMLTRIGRSRIQTNKQL